MRRKRLLLPPALTIMLSLCFLYLNPYSNLPPNPSTQLIVLGLLVGPALLVFASFFLHVPAMKYIGFAASLPVGFYLGLAGFPSLWSLLIPSIICYLFIPADSHSRM